MLKSFRYFLFPFSIIYGGVISFRNFLYNKKIKRSASFNFPIICVGNLAVGGTGKTPMTEYLIEILQHRYQTATLSRGYKRKTKGFAIADERTTAIEIGDEPMQFHQKYKNVTVAVGEERLEAVPQILHLKPNTEVIILDDAYQHRSINAGLNILLTDFKNLYTRDFIIPAGHLRDVRTSSNRADIIIVTKCPSNLSESQKQDIIEEIDPTDKQQVFFTEIMYSAPFHLFNGTQTGISSSTEVLLITGIANPKSLKDFLSKVVKSFETLRYPDHHIFTSTDLKDIKKHFDEIKSPNKVIITTEKDGVRLKKFETELSNLPIFVLPIKHHFLFNEAPAFNKKIIEFIEGFHTIS